MIEIRTFNALNELFGDQRQVSLFKDFETEQEVEDFCQNLDEYQVFRLSDEDRDESWRTQFIVVYPNPEYADA